MNLILMFQQQLQEAGETAHGATGGAEHGATPVWITWLNEHVGVYTIGLQEQIMTPIYSALGGHYVRPGAADAIPAHVWLAMLAFLICTVGILLFRGTLSVDRPTTRQQFLEVLVTTVRGMLDDVVGPFGRRYLAVIGAFAVFIVIGNLMGIIPGLGAPTGNINVTLGLGIISFVYYITRGFKQQGIGYLKHFTGGLTGALLPIGFVIFFFEMISNFVRPVTLGIRLFLNMFADHTIGGVFENMTPWIVPILLPLPLAVFVALVQTMVFIMLSMVYLSETVPHEEHDHDEHGEHASLAERQEAVGVAHAH